MGYVKHAAMVADDINWFIETARADNLDLYYPDQGVPARRHMPIDTRGTLEEQDGLLYEVAGLSIFVPDHVFGLVQPKVEPAANNQGEPVGYHGLNVSDL